MAPTGSIACGNKGYNALANEFPFGGIKSSTGHRSCEPGRDGLEFYIAYCILPTMLGLGLSKPGSFSKNPSVFISPENWSLLCLARCQGCWHTSVVSNLRGDTVIELQIGNNTLQAGFVIFKIINDIVALCVWLWQASHSWGRHFDLFFTWLRMNLHSSGYVLSPGASSVTRGVYCLQPALG